MRLGIAHAAATLKAQKAAEALDVGAGGGADGSVYGDSADDGYEGFVPEFLRDLVVPAAGAACGGGGRGGGGGDSGGGGGVPECAGAGHSFEYDVADVDAAVARSVPAGAASLASPVGAGGRAVAVVDCGSGGVKRGRDGEDDSTAPASQCARAGGAGGDAPAVPPLLSERVMALVASRGALPAEELAAWGGACVRAACRWVRAQRARVQAHRHRPSRMPT